jgi:hypothetical protein
MYEGFSGSRHKPQLYKMTLSPKQWSRGFVQDLWPSKSLGNPLVPWRSYYKRWMNISGQIMIFAKEVKRCKGTQKWLGLRREVSFKKHLNYTQPRPKRRKSCSILRSTILAPRIRHITTIFSKQLLSTNSKRRKGWPKLWVRFNTQLRKFYCIFCGENEGDNMSVTPKILFWECIKILQRFWIAITYNKKFIAWKLHSLK